LVVRIPTYLRTELIFNQVKSNQIEAQQYGNYYEIFSVEYENQKCIKDDEVWHNRAPGSKIQEPEQVEINPEKNAGDPIVCSSNSYKPAIKIEKEKKQRTKPRK
jgi:hypothetical protein